MSRKHFVAAAFAAVVAPLALGVGLASAQTPTCTGGIISGLVWFDANNNGIQDPGEEPIEGAVVSIIVGEGTVLSTETDASGHYQFCNLVDNAFYQVMATVPAGDTPSPANVTEVGDSDGECCLQTEGEPDQTFTMVELIGSNTTTDFGFWHEGGTPPPGTGTPGYWKNHPGAWPPSIVVGGVTYTAMNAINIMNNEVGGDKSYTLFNSLISAMLNKGIGNPTECVDPEIAAGNSWIAANPPGSKVKASGVQWKIGEPIHRKLDNYNNGMLCAPHRD
jgi:hypothetical protein